MNRTDIPEIKTLNWKEQEGSVVVAMGADKYILNSSSSIVWNKINGINTIQDIIDSLINEYGEENSDEYLAEIVDLAINDFIENKLVVIRTTNEFDGWLQYE